METKRVRRRTHSAELRAQVVQACRQPGASVAAIALRNGLNANVVYRWLKLDGQSVGDEVRPGTAVSNQSVTGFVPVQMQRPVHTPAASSVAAATDIRIELRRGASTVTLSWPLVAACECAAWLSEWLR